MNDIVSFLNGEKRNASGWLLSEIWKFTDSEIENTHTFIQWIFPTSEGSRATPGSPVLDEDQIDQINNSDRAKKNLRKSADWYFNFLRRNGFWKKPHDHNHLRITRLIKSLRLLCGDDEADYYKERLWQLLGADISIIPSKTIDYWENA